MYNTMFIKPGQSMPPASTVSLLEEPEFTVYNDNAILLYIPKCNLYGFITVGGGDGPMACGDQEFEIPPDEDTYIYLESGRYARHVNGKLKIKVWSDQAFPASMIQLL